MRFVDSLAQMAQFDVNTVHYIFFKKKRAKNFTLISFFADRYVEIVLGIHFILFNWFALYLGFSYSFSIKSQYQKIQSLEIGRISLWNKALETIRHCCNLARVHWTLVIERMTIRTYRCTIDRRATLFQNVASNYVNATLANAHWYWCIRSSRLPLRMVIISSVAQAA